MNEQTLFAEALERIDPQERAAFLDQACREDTLLRRRIERLLAQHQHAGGFLEAPQMASVPTIGEPVAENPGTVIGPYKLLQQIGEGGFGVVFMAEQKVPVRRKVALKVLKPGMDTRQVVARFEAERQALAMMDHPNIAHVFDGGQTPSGRPYFVMELVRGVPITECCDQNHMSLRERLELFVTVCQAVQHAHQKGIIHRDLKPSNILIESHDGTPVPKVIDFGIAKAMSGNLTDKTIFTRFEQMIGTPLYMSPEQAGQSSLDVDTRSDIYSLGVLLYELLTGTTPFDKEQLSKLGYDELRRIICETEPPKPSTRLSTLGQAATTVSTNRQSDPRKLSQQIRGELDWIVMKSLEKDRNRRYETASAFAADVQRYLNDEPVQACPPSAGYRLRKFARRNKAVMLATIAVLMALSAGLASTTLALFEAQHQREVAENDRSEAEKARSEEGKQRDRAQKNEQEAREKAQESGQVLNFLEQKMLDSCRPEDDGGLGKDVTVRKAIDAAEKELAHSFKDQPIIEASIRHSLGNNYISLGEPKLAITQLQRVVEIRMAVYGPYSMATLNAKSSLALALADSGNLEHALALREEVLATRRRVLSPDFPNSLETPNMAKAGGGLPQGSWGHQYMLRAMLDVARSYQEVDKFDRALVLFEETLAKQKETLGADDKVLQKQKEKLTPDHLNTLVAMNDLALCYNKVGKFDQAVELLEHVWEKHKETFGPDHRKTLAVVRNLGYACFQVKKNDKGLEFLKQNWKATEAKLGPDDPETLKSTYALAWAYRQAGQLDKAVPMFKEVLQKKKKRLGPDHPSTLITMSMLGMTYVDVGEVDEGLRLLVEAEAAGRKKLGADHSRTLERVGNLASSYMRANRLDQAVPLYEQILDAFAAKLGADHFQTLDAMSDLAYAYLRAGKLDQAVKLLEQVVPKFKKTFGPDHPNTQIAVKNLGNVYYNMGKADKGLQLLEQNLAAIEAKLGPDHLVTLDSMHTLASAYLVTERFELAVPILKKVFQKWKEKLGADHKRTLSAMADLGEAHLNVGEVHLGLRLMEDAATAQKEKLGPEHTDTVKSLGNLVEGYLKAKQPKKALPILQPYLDVRKKLLGPKSPDLAGIQASIALELLNAGLAKEAEPILRECLDIRSQKAPDDWRTFQTRSMLGGSLAGQKKYDEAEKYLLAGYKGMKDREAKIEKVAPAQLRLTQSLERLVQLYDAWGKKEEAATWREKLATHLETKKKNAKPKDQP